MSLHDAYARRTPFELAFRDTATAETLIREIEAEVEGRGADPRNPHAFVTMGSVERFVRGLEGPDAPPGAIHTYGALAFHGVHFARADYPLFLLSTHAARYLVGGAPEGRPEFPSPAGYLQLPQHLFWTRRGADAPESVDGVFWTGHGGETLHSLLVSGMRPDRAGVSVTPLPEAPLADATTWMNVDVRGAEGDFASDLPGGEIDGLYGVSTTGEVLKLLARFFAYLHAVPEALSPSASGPETSEDGPEPSSLPFRRVRLAD
jgi:hypothetical protein